MKRPASGHERDLVGHAPGGRLEELMEQHPGASRRGAQGADAAGTPSGLGVILGLTVRWLMNISSTSIVESMPTKAMLSAKPIARPVRHFS